MLEWIPSTTPGGAPYAVRLVASTADDAPPARVSSDALPATFTETAVDEGDLTPWQRNLVRHSPENFARPDSSQSLASMAALTDCGADGDGEASTDEDAPGLDLEGHDDAAAADAAAAPPPPPLRRRRPRSSTSSSTSGRRPRRRSRSRRRRRCRGPPFPVLSLDKYFLESSCFW